MSEGATLFGPLIASDTVKAQSLHLPLDARRIKRRANKEPQLHDATEDLNVNDPQIENKHDFQQPRPSHSANRSRAPSKYEEATWPGKLLVTRELLIALALK